MFDVDIINSILPIQFFFDLTKKLNITYFFIIRILALTRMFKRKVENCVLPSHDDTGVTTVYKNPLNSDTIGMITNHIIFNCNVTVETLNITLNTIKKITESYKYVEGHIYIYLHISSFGGSLCALRTFISEKNKLFPNLQLISVIEKNCTDVGFLLAAICEWRIIRKNAYCSMTILNPNTKYWGAYKQLGEDILPEIETIFDNCKLKATKEKLLKYLLRNNTWKCKKMLKIGFVDEIY